MSELDIVSRAIELLSIDRYALSGTCSNFVNELKRCKSEEEAIALVVSRRQHFQKLRLDIKRIEAFLDELYKHIQAS